MNKTEERAHYNHYWSPISNQTKNKTEDFYNIKTMAQGKNRRSGTKNDTPARGKRFEK